MISSNYFDLIIVYSSRDRSIGLVVRVFAKVRETRIQFQVESYQKLEKWYLMPHHYKILIKGKVEQSSKRINEKGAFGSPSTMVTNFTYSWF